MVEPGPLDDLWRPSPTGTLIASLILFGGVMLGVTLLGVLVAGGTGQARRGRGMLGGVVAVLRAADLWLVRRGGWLVGTRVRLPWQRGPRVLLTFAVLAAAGTALPFTPAMAALALGLLAVLVVFRHWSRDETARETVEGMAEPAALPAPIEGDLRLEMALACGSLLVTVPLAFARLHAAGYAFQLEETAGPFAFVFYMVIELAKLGTVVDYYDLFADQISFGHLAQAHHPHPLTRYVMLAFRVLFDVIILVALKRLFDIIRRVSSGLDLRDLRAALESWDEADDAQALARLKGIAAGGSAEAVALLAQVARGTLVRGDRRLRYFSTEARIATARMLLDVKAPDEALEALQELEREAQFQGLETPPEVAEGLAAARRQVTGRQQEERRQEVEAQIAQLRQELAAGGPGLQPGTALRAERQRELARALRYLAGATGQHALLEEALAALREAQAFLDRTQSPREWAQLEREAGQLLRRVGERRGEMARLREAEAAFNAVLPLLDQVADESLWAATQYELALALRGLWLKERRERDLQRARRAIRAALKARPDMASWKKLGEQLAREAGGAGRPAAAAA